MIALFRKNQPERHLPGECLLPQMRERIHRREIRRSIRSWKTASAAHSDADGTKASDDYIPLDVISQRGTLAPPSPKTLGRLFLCAVAAGLLAVWFVF